ncbi:MAG: S8 family serine peptidase, partial [Erysipelotrichaceae bacterium]|nr:S8 family serine peptidase [Erysipelotrichaceae bacterium]
MNYVRAEETGEGFGGEPITEVEKNGLFSSPLLGEFEEEQEQEDTSELYDAIYEDTDVVRVSIVLRGDSAIDAGYSIEGIGTNYWANSYRDSLKRQQDSVAKRIANRVLDGEELEVVWNHTLAANIMSAYVPYGKIEEIKKISGVKDVFIENKYEAATTSGGSVNDPNMITSRDMTQTTGENASEYTGQGSKVAIIDTGLDIEHISFDADAFMHAAEEDGFADQLMTEADVKAVEGSLNVPGQYLNEKIPYYYNYVDGNLDVSHVNDTESGHGSHVAGIAAANKYIEEEDGSFVNAVEKYYAVGQAPDAQVFVMKVFGAGGGAYDSDYFAAIEDAIVLGADSVNLSLGSSVPGFVYANNEYQDILNNLVDKGTVIVFSAGNNSSWDQVSQLYADDINYSAGGTPGTYLNTFSVASVDNDGYTGEMLDISGELIPFGESASYGNLPIATLAGDHEYIYVDAIGYIYDQDYDYGVNLFEFIPELVEGRIAACNRGSSSFYMKANGAVEAGAIATIIVNNQPGAMGGMNLKGYEHTEPVVSILQTDGELLKDKATEKGTFTGIELVYDEEGNLTGYQEKDYDYYIGKITVSGDISNIKYNSETYMVSDFSSWGVPGSLILKPEIAAPGGNIYSLKALQLAEDDKGNVYSTGGHDEYELESGTSMAAPQIAGIIAVIAQYYRENDIEAKTGLTLRQFAQSLLMSTATPLIDDYDCYFPVLQQGAGLANVEGVVSAKSFIHMSEDDETLTAKTGVAADYKIKAEMGDDASRAGQYEYTFDITNFGDETIKYNLNTDLFTQDIEEWEDTEYLAHYTTDITGNVTYNIVVDAEGHDVDKDGDTDQDDAQAILDYLTGNRDGAELDLEAGKLDEDDEVTSRDAYLLLMFLENEYGIGEDWFYLQAGKQATVTVSIDVSSSALKGRENGGYVEGFTYVKGDKDVEHSIPLLAYYGSWTDPSMYDAVSYLEQAMGSSEKYSYFDAENTNGYQLKYKDNRTAWFTGNPYVAEPDIDEERFAMNSATTIRNARYTLIRNGIAREVLIKDAEGNIVKKTGFANGATYGAFYNSQTTNPGWEQTGAQRVTISTKPADLGFAEGDQFSVELYNVPEYYGLLASEVSGNSITEDQLLGYIEDGEVGDGAVLGYSFTVDDTAPVISKYEMSEDKSTITVTAKDNYYIAFIGLMDVTGNEVILAEVPEQSAPGEEVTVTLDVTSVENLPNAAALVVGDYAHNEEIRLARFREGTVEYKYYVYQLTDEIVDGGEYIIANSNVAGKAYALYTNDPGFYTSSARTVIHDDAEIPYIKVEDAEDKILWESTAFVAGGQLYGYFITSVADGGYLRDLDPDTPFANLPGMNYGGLFMYDENLMYAYPYESGMYYDSGYFMFGEPAPVYLYVKTEIVEEIDPEEVSSITINPSSVTLIMGVDESRQLTTTISPVTVEDKSVTWTSGDPEIATVDENGLVKAVSVGEVTVTATSNKTPDMSATVNVNVVEAEPMNAYIYGLVSNADGVGIAMIDMNDMATYPAMSEVDE